ncbi:glycosyltransferase family 4 protein [Chitinophaga qingshengii]|uniref:Glycosyltransferase family 4 protein n=1 Tax=Chitinophaga qingshengii TaxID=1569794 RepID=A0ABR7TW13_9BACT|nr:glycosyltransferase family 4 protein [Chitinophaga qingshengii]MBC9933807.1 glycosyltransferase family 4 protein [Chitinophaga qingshengii]
MVKKNVLIFTDCYIYGGSERLMTFLLSNQLLNEQFDLTLAFRSHKSYVEGLNSDLRKWGVEAKTLPVTLLSNTALFHRISCSGLHPLIKKGIKIPFYLVERLGIYFVFNIFVILGFLLKKRPDIVHVNNGGYPGARSCNQFVLCCHILKIRSIVYQVNNIAYPPGSIFSRWYDKLIGKYVYSFITASSQARLALISQRSFDATKIVQIPNTVKLEATMVGRAEILAESGWPEDTFLLVQVAFLTARKGQIYLLRALKEIRDSQHPVLTQQLRVLLVGNGEDEGLLKAYVADNHLQDYVFFTGYRANSVDFIQACDVFILPSVANEDMPLALLAAMNMGKPLISTGFAGILEAIKNGENGILISNAPDEITAQLKSAIIQMFESPDKRAVLGVEARRTFNEKYSEAAYGKALSRLYDMSLQGGGIAKNAY